MKKIGIDARLIYQTGVGVYTRNLLFFLAQNPREDLQYHAYASSQDIHTFLIENPHIDNASHVVFHPCDAKWHGFAEQITFFFQLMRDDLDLMHFLYFSWPVLYMRRFIATVHDVTPLYYETGRLSKANPWWYRVKHTVFRFVFTQQLSRAQLVIVPTETVAMQLTGLVSAQKVQVIYEGVSHEVAESGEDREIAQELPKDYLLYVGNLYPHKNVSRLIDAFAVVHEEQPHIRLVLVGPDNTFVTQMRSYIADKGLENAVVWCTDASNAELVTLYRHARMLVNPSLTEGFGLPVLEALHFGCPVAISDIPVFHEIAGEKGEYFDPHSMGAIAAAIKKVLAKARGEKQNLADAKFSFRRMVREIMEIYERFS